MNEIDMRNICNFQKLWCRLAMDDLWNPGNVDAVYMPALSTGMIDSCSLFDAILKRSDTYTYVTFNSLDGKEAAKHGCAGATYYRSKLLDVNNKIIPADSGTHTRGECDTLIQLAKEHAWKRLLFATVPYHWPRVIASIVGSMAAFEYRPRVYFLRPNRIDLHKPMLGSQGIERTTYIEAAGNDAMKFFTYLDEGAKNNGNAWKTQYGAPFEEIFAYLDWRDSERGEI